MAHNGLAPKLYGYDGLSTSISSHVKNLLMDMVCLCLIDVDLGLTQNNNCTEQTRDTSQ